MPVINLENDRWFVKQVRLGKLQVNKRGKVFNPKTNKFIGAVGSGQYPKISMADENKKIRHMQIHRLVWLVYKGPIKQGYEINHRDGIKTNPRLSNLEHISHGDNVKHSLYILNNYNYEKEFEKSKVFRKLTEKEVLKIKKSKLSDKELGIIFKVSRATIYSIRKELSWSWLK